MKKICVTGANGFIGKSICNKLIRLGMSVRGSIRSKSSSFNNSNYDKISVGNINSETNWSKALKNCNCIIHCAGVTESKKLSMKNHEIFEVNFEGTKKLALDAVSAGVKKIIFLSSIKVNGESTNKYLKNKGSKKKTFTKAFNHTDIPAPQDDYAKSKLKAEKELWNISKKTGLQVVVLRLPLVYGVGVKNNLYKMLKIIRSGIPLPFKGIKNKRSLIGIDNLIDVIYACITNPNANGKTFLLSDGDDISTPDLLYYLSSSMGRQLNLFYIPVFLLKIFGYIFFKRKEIVSLTDSLQIDNSLVRKMLNWKPQVTVKDGIRKMVKKNDKIF